MEVDDFGRVDTCKSGENFENYDIIDVRELGQNLPDSRLEKSTPMDRHQNTPASIPEHKMEYSNEFLMSVPDMV